MIRDCESMKKNELNYEDIWKKSWCKWGFGIEEVIYFDQCYLLLSWLMLFELWRVITESFGDWLIC